jgi:DNA-binding response OmpR family regulator
MTGTGARKRILVIDDNPFALELTQSALEKAGFAVATALDLTAFEHARAAAAPDLILVDVQMPEAFGDDVAATLKGERGVRVPILLVSNVEERELARRAEEAEADGWVSKGAGLAELVRRVKELLD